MTIRYEIRRGLRRAGRSIILVSKEELPDYTGFRSIYGFDDDAQEYITNEKTTAGLAGHNFYSDDLLVDFDDAWQAGEDMVDELCEYSYRLYDTGGRSLHLEVDIEPMYGPDVPAIQRAWMKKFYPVSDTGIYKSSGIYRLPGTWHHKRVGQRKILLEENKGNRLEIGDVREATVWGHYDTIDDVDTDLGQILDILLLKPINAGGRNNRLFTIARLCKKCGETYDATIRIAEFWNEEFCHPALSRQELTTTIRSAYGGV